MKNQKDGLSPTSGVTMVYLANNAIFLTFEKNWKVVRELASSSDSRMAIQYSYETSIMLKF